MRQVAILAHVVQAVCGTVLALSLLSVVDAQVMSSPSYQLQSDSVNVGGGLSSSTAYIQESTTGEIATGRSESAAFNLRAGYQQLQEVFISLSAPTDVLMNPSIPGITGGVSYGSTTVTVITDSPGGYMLLLSAEADPAMQSGSNSIPNYPAGTPDFAFTVPAASARFGVSPEGVDIPDVFRDDTFVCGVGVSDTPLACWTGIATTGVAMAESSNGNQPDGATTTLQFQLGVTAGAGVMSGEYTATTTLTALTL